MLIPLSWYLVEPIQNIFKSKFNRYIGTFIQWSLVLSGIIDIQLITRIQNSRNSITKRPNKNLEELFLQQMKTAGTALLSVQKMPAGPWHQVKLDQKVFFYKMHCLPELYLGKSMTTHFVRTFLSVNTPETAYSASFSVPRLIQLVKWFHPRPPHHLTLFLIIPKRFQSNFGRTSKSDHIGTFSKMVDETGLNQNRFEALVKLFVNSSNRKNDNNECVPHHLLCNIFSRESFTEHRTC